jgi:hypothetical protein
MLAKVILSEGAMYPLPPSTCRGTIEMVAVVSAAALMNCLLLILFFRAMLVFEKWVSEPSGSFRQGNEK